MTKPAFRVIDTGLREGRANIAFDQALIDAHKAGEAPDTIRFLRFPPTALIGRHQALSQEVQLAHCYDNDIGVVRRITGGGAIYFDEGQLGWELAFDRKTLGISSLADLTKAICEAAALGISHLGVDAKFRPRNDIEVDGRKICGTGGFFDGDTLFYQGTLLIDMDPSHMVAALKVPAAKLKKRSLDSAEQRVTTLKALLGEDMPALPAIQNSLLAGFAVGLGIEPAWGEITPAEESRANVAFDEEIGTDEFVHEIDDPGAGDNVSDRQSCLPRRRGVLLSAAGGAGRAAHPRGSVHRRFLRHSAAHGLRPGGQPSWRSGGRGGRGGREILRPGLCRSADDHAGRFPRRAGKRDRGRLMSNISQYPIFVVQHTSGEFLGLMEDHLEGRGIRFNYFRPFTAGGGIPATMEFSAGLILLGGGPWGTKGGRAVPTLTEELELARQAIDLGKPVVGIGLGAQILAIAAGGGSEASDWCSSSARRPGPATTRWAASCPNAFRW